MEKDKEKHKADLEKVELERKKIEAAQKERYEAELLRAKEQKVKLGLRDWIGIKMQIISDHRYILETQQPLMETEYSFLKHNFSQHVPETPTFSTIPFKALGLMVGAYVTVSEKYLSCGDAASGPLAPGKAGQVVKQDSSEIPFMVRGMDGWSFHDVPRITHH